MWGQSGRDAVAALLPPEVRERTASMRPLPDWIPLDDLIAWHVAVWNGPANHDEAVFTEHIRKTVDQGFGRVKRVLLSMATSTRRAVSRRAPSRTAASPSPSAITPTCSTR